jgi:hypothetical protein
MSEEANAYAFPPTPVLVIVDAYVEPEHEDEFNRWYDEKHLPESIACPGFRIGARSTTRRR